MTETAVERMLYAGPGHMLTIRPAVGEDADALFTEVCARFANSRIEQDAEGSIFIVAPKGGESSDQNAEITSQLRIWSKHDGRGRCFDSSVLFLLPDGSKMGPDAAWVGNEQLKALNAAERRKFLPLVPEFIIELKSPSDRVSDLEKKMAGWRGHGVACGLLINPEERWVKIYRAGTMAVETQHDVDFIGDVEGPVAGFTLDLVPVWRGLDL